MDQLDILKKQWQSREQEFPKLSYDDIYKMLLKKSSSIVKWIFIISIAELLFWVGIMFLLPDSYKEITEAMGISTLMFYSNILHFVIFTGFIVYFYRNYLKIRVTDSIKKLMNNILNTRKTVRYFVYYNIGMFVISSIIVNIIYYINSDQLYEVMDFASKGVPQDNFASAFIIAQVIVGILFVGILMLFYWVVYGILLGRLNKNYKELKKMEV